MVWLLLCRCRDTWEVLVWDLVDGPPQTYSVPPASLSLAICSVRECSQPPGLICSHPTSSPYERWAAAHPLSNHIQGTPTSVAAKPNAIRSQRVLPLLFQMQVKDCSWDVGCSFPHSCLVRSFDKTPKGRRSFDQWAGVICVYLSNCSQFMS